MIITTRRDFIKNTAIAAASAAVFNPENMTGVNVFSTESRTIPAVRSKRDLVLEVLDMKKTPSYVPAAFFMHFGVTGSAALNAHKDYFRATGMDFVKIQFDEQSLPPEKEIRKPEDWSKIPVRDEKWFEPTLWLLKNLIKELKSEALIIQTVYSPFQMAKQAVPVETIIEHVKLDPDAVVRGMENITLSIINFLDAAVRLGVDGFYTCTQGGEINRITDISLFNKTVKAYDMILYKKVLESSQFNIMHICDYEGTYTDFVRKFRDYPGHVVNVPLAADNKPLTMNEASAIFNRPVMGGLDRHGIFSTGSADDAKKAANEVLKNAPDNFILGADCTVNSKIPMENLQAAIKAAHEFRL